jgi:hypothetical protein
MFNYVTAIKKSGNKDTLILVCKNSFESLEKGGCKKVTDADRHLRRIV